MSKAQVSIEYLIVMGFIFIISIPLVIVYYDFTSDSTDEIASRQVFQIAQKIVDTAESVYYNGEPSQTIIKVYLPSHVESASIEENLEVVFRFKSKDGLSDIIGFSRVNITGSLPISEGIHFITLKAVDNQVVVSSN